MSHMSNSWCKGEVGWVGRRSRFIHAWTCVPPSYEYLPTPCRTRATVGVTGRSGGVGGRSRFILAWTLCCSILRTPPCCSSERRPISNIIGAQSPPPNDAQCPGESERGKCRGGWVGVWCAGASCRSRRIRQPRGRSVRGPKKRFKRHFTIVNSGILSFLPDFTFC